MINKILFGNRSIDLLKGGLDAGTQRMSVIAENLANVTTPGYQARRVEFEELILEAQEAINLQQTDGSHLASSTDGPGAVPLPEVKADPAPTPAGALNNVDMEQELVLMKQNEIHFRALSQLIARKYRGIDSAIR